MRAWRVAVVAALVGGTGWLAKIVIMALQGGPDPDSIPEAIAFFAGLLGVLVAAAAFGVHRAQSGTTARRIVYAVGAVAVTIAVVGLGQTVLGALGGDGWLWEEAIFGLVGLAAVAAAGAALRTRDTARLDAPGS
jgi:hypothetical protein